jgi:hypothetical protein
MRVQSRHSARIVSITRSGVGVRVRGLDGGADDPNTLRAEDRVERDAELRVTVANEVPDGARTRVEAHHEVPGLLGNPGGVGVNRRWAEGDPPAAKLDEHEDVDGTQPGRLDSEEVARDDALRLRPQELAPGRAAASRGRPRSRRSEQGPDRRRTHSQAELAQLALDPHAAPARVLPGKPEDQRTDLRFYGWPARTTGPAVRPLSPHELAVPPEEGRWGDEEGDPAVPRDRPARRGEEDPVDGLELRSPRRPLQHPELVAEDEDLEVLRVLVSATLGSAGEEAHEGANDDVEERPHRPIVPGRSARIGVFDPHGPDSGN